MYIYIFKGAKICCPIGYNEFVDFLKKIKNTDLLISAKLNSKTHLQNASFNFFSVLLAFGFKA
jgi:hypothetical protein